MIKVRDAIEYKREVLRYENCTFYTHALTKQYKLQNAHCLDIKTWDKWNWSERSSGSALMENQMHHWLVKYLVTMFKLSKDWQKARHKCCPGNVCLPHVNTLKRIGYPIQAPNCNTCKPYYEYVLHDSERQLLGLFEASSGSCYIWRFHRVAPSIKQNFCLGIK